MQHHSEMINSILASAWTHDTLAEARQNAADLRKNNDIAIYGRNEAKQPIYATGHPELCNRLGYTTIVEITG